MTTATNQTRVVVTGLGTTSPVGGDVTSTWEGLLAGQSGVNVLKHDWAEQLGTQNAAEVAVDPTDVLDRVKARRLDRSGRHGGCCHRADGARHGADRGDRRDGGDRQRLDGRS